MDIIERAARANPDDELRELLAKFAAVQEPFDAEFAKILEDNIQQLYEP